MKLSLQLSTRYDHCNMTSHKTCTHTHTVYLPYSYNSIGDEDKEDDEGFNKGCDRPLPFFEPSQRLWEINDKTVRIHYRVVHLCISIVCVYNRIKLIHCITNKLSIHTPCCGNNCDYLCIWVCFLTKEMHAASSKIRTNRSSNCSKTSSQSDFPAQGQQVTQWERKKDS